MSDFEKTVHFDPGYAKFSVDLPDDIYNFVEGIKQVKPAHTQKFKFSQLEATLSKLISQIAGVYLGCMLWGAFIHHRFKDSPKEIEGNPAFEMSYEELQQLDYNDKPDKILEFMEKFNRDCKYVLNRPFKIDSQVVEIVKSYKEFVLLNQNFKTTKYTNDVKLPETLNHFSNLSSEKLDELYNRIFEVINSDKIETILNLGFYK